MYQQRNSKHRVRNVLLASVEGGGIKRLYVLELIVFQFQIVGMPLVSIL